MLTDVFLEPAGGQPAVRGRLHLPETPLLGLVLTHGAGSNSEAPLLLALSRELERLGVAVLRCDLPYRQERPHGPPWPASAGRDRAGIRRAAEALRERVQAEVWIGGHSYGGRQASMLAAEDPAAAAGLLLLSYPLHPPGKPEQPRTAHLPQLAVPALFVHGEADPFASPAELAAARELIPARTGLLSLPGAGHDLTPRGRKRGDVAAQIADRFAAFAGLLPEEPVILPVTDVFDLHSVPPRDVEGVVEAYLEEARRAGLRALRIIHGQGIGVQRETVRRVLARTPGVLEYRDAPEGAGGRGATVVTLAP